MERTTVSKDAIRRLYDLCEIGNTFDCWPWVGATYSNGAGYLRVGARRISAHRVAYAHHYNDDVVEEGVNIVHKCGNRACCNPLHLYNKADAMLWTTKERT